MLCIFKFYYSFKLQTSYHIYFKFPSMGSPSWASLLCDNPVCRIWQNSTRSCVCNDLTTCTTCNMIVVPEQWRIQERGPRPLNFRPNWGSKGQKIFFWRPAFPLPQPPLPRYLKVWIQQCRIRVRCMPIERLSIRRMPVLGAFPVVLDGLISNFLGGACPADLPSVLIFHRSVLPKEGLRTRLQTTTSPLICV